MAEKAPIIDMLKKDIRNELQEIYGQLLKAKAKKRIKLPAKILLTDDHHLPFADMEMVEEMLSRDGDADGFVWGEVINFDAFAVYVKNYISNPEQEDLMAENMVNLYLEHFKYGFTLDNNHMKRLDKMLARILDPIQLAYIRNRFQGLLPTFTHISKKVKYVGLPVVQLGKAVFAHFDDFSSVPGRTVEWVMQGIMNWSDCYGITDDFDSVWIGHTHNQNYHTMYKKMVVEAGCMCHAQDYLFRGKMSAAHRKFRWVNGYGVVYLQKDGSTDMKKSHTQFLGFAKLPEI